MPKYAVSLGVVSRMVVLEAANAQQALDNVLVTVEPNGLALIPREDKRESWWFARNSSDSKDEVVVKNTDVARKMLAKLRSDVLDVFWFVSLDENGKRQVRKGKKTPAF